MRNIYSHHQLHSNFYHIPIASKKATNRFTKALFKGQYFFAKFSHKKCYIFQKIPKITSKSVKNQLNMAFWVMKKNDVKLRQMSLIDVKGQALFDVISTYRSGTVISKVYVEIEQIGLKGIFTK